MRKFKELLIKEILSASYAQLITYACEEIKKQLNNLHGKFIAYDADSKTLAVSKHGEKIDYIWLHTFTYSVRACILNEHKIPNAHLWIFYWGNEENQAP